MNVTVTSQYLQMLIFIKQGDSDKILKVNHGRQSGHTSAMIDLATSDDILVVRNANIQQHLRVKTENKLNIHTPTSLYRYRGKSMKFRYIFVDDASRILSIDSFDSDAFTLSEFIARSSYDIQIHLG